MTRNGSVEVAGGSVLAPFDPVRRTHDPFHRPDRRSTEDHSAHPRPARWLMLLVGSQVMALAVDFGKLGLTREEEVDIERWLILSPGQVFFGLFLLVASAHLVRALREPPAFLLLLWLAWGLATVMWSTDPRQTLIQSIGAINLTVIGVWYLWVFGTMPS